MSWICDCGAVMKDEDVECVNCGTEDPEKEELAREANNDSDKY